MACVSALQASSSACLPGCGRRGGLFLVRIRPLARPLVDADDDELGWLYRGAGGLADECAHVARFRWIGLLVALDVVRLVLGRADQGALLPEIGEEDVDRAHDLLPQRRLVGLEHYPLRVLLHALAHEDEQAPHVDLYEGGIGAQRARAPDADAATDEGDERVEPLVERGIALALAHPLR